MANPLKKLEKAYREHYPAMAGFLFKLTKDRLLIDDLIQDVFLSILKKPEVFSGIKNIEAWFIQAAKYKFIDHTRKKKEVLLSNDRFFHELKHDSFVEESVQVNEEVEKLLKQLNKEDREYVIAKYYYGLTYAEIGQLADKSPAAIKIRIHRTKKRLKERRGKNDG
ncbi:RNA polymerase sigma factor [Thalassobacillus hwangdonensis]|uniref:RNA polymerase sigma factor n=1 Tax=Thalassobacillus hwangdonensis TaxID=546108 RepID=A0ABW3L4X4_9BACI